MVRPLYKLHWNDATEAECDKFIAEHSNKITDEYLIMYGYYNMMRFNFASYPDNLSCKRDACQIVARELNDYMG